MSDEASFGTFGYPHAEDDASRRRQPTGQSAQRTGGEDPYRREAQRTDRRDDRDQAMDVGAREQPRRDWHPDDPHYAQHRSEQERLLDAEYQEFCAWRRARFREDFETWRRERQSRSASTAPLDRPDVRSEARREPAGEPFREIGTDSMADVRAGAVAPAGVRSEPVASVRAEPIASDRTEGEREMVRTETFFERS